MAKTKLPSFGEMFDKVKQKFQDGVLVPEIDFYLTQVYKAAYDKAPTQNIKDHIRIRFAKQEGSLIVGGLEVDLRKGPREVGPDSVASPARAYEYGSGIHATRGEAGTYVIVPYKRKVLAFYWEKAYDWIPRLPDGRVMLAKVNHPGVMPRPYMRPAFEETKKPILIKLLLKKSQAEFFTSFRESTQ